MTAEASAVTLESFDLSLFGETAGLLGPRQDLVSGPQAGTRDDVPRCREQVTGDPLVDRCRAHAQQLGDLSRTHQHARRRCHHASVPVAVVPLALPVAAVGAGQPDRRDPLLGPLFDVIEPSSKGNAVNRCTVRGQEVATDVVALRVSERVEEVPLATIGADPTTTLVTTTRRTADADAQSLKVSPTRLLRRRHRHGVSMFLHCHDVKVSLQMNRRWPRAHLLRARPAMCPSSQAAGMMHARARTRGQVTSDRLLLKQLPGSSSLVKGSCHRRDSESSCAADDSETRLEPCTRSWSLAEGRDRFLKGCCRNALSRRNPPTRHGPFCLELRIGELLGPARRDHDRSPGAKSDATDIGLTKDERHRADVGDLDSLARSLKDIGFIHPLVVRADGVTLVAGARRLAAAKMIGLTAVPVRILDTADDMEAWLRAERDENTERKDLTWAEKVSLGRELEELLTPLAKERQEEGRREGGRVHMLKENVTSSRSHPQVADEVAEALGGERAVPLEGAKSKKTFPRLRPRTPRPRMRCRRHFRTMAPPPQLDQRRSPWVGPTPTR